jgi:hypothetical protein
LGKPASSLPVTLFRLRPSTGNAPPPPAIDQSLIICIVYDLRCLLFNW